MTVSRLSARTATARYPKADRLVRAWKQKATTNASININRDSVGEVVGK